MAREILFGLDGIDLERVPFGKDAIRAEILQRHEMEHLDGVIHLDLEKQRAVGYKDVGGDEFWARGHIPGRPILPGMLIVEAAAQLSSFFFKRRFPEEKRFLGFAGLDEVRFRGSVRPGDRLLLLVEGEDLRPRRAIFRTQALVDGKIVYEGLITGMPI